MEIHRNLSQLYSKPSQKQEAYIERIAFGDVHPLYSAIDIRNSSTERSKSIKADIVEQLHLAKKQLLIFRQ